MSDDLLHVLLCLWEAAMLVIIGLWLIKITTTHMWRAYCTWQARGAGTWVLRAVANYLWHIVKMPMIIGEHLLGERQTPSLR